MFGAMVLKLSLLWTVGEETLQVLFAFGDVCVSVCPCVCLDVSAWMCLLEEMLQVEMDI